MPKLPKQFLTAADVAEIIGISMSKSYELIRNMNAELEADGYLTVRGKVPAAFFEAKCYGVKVAAGD